jgi:hypothetical protein
MADQILTQDYLKSIFSYEDGNLYWKITKGNNAKAGKLAGCIKRYRLIRLNDKIYGAHVLIWAMHYGMPNTNIDHINMNELDNRLENLRLANKSQNGCNRPKQANNKSGYKNVCWYKRYKKWKVALQVNKKDKTIGYFEDLELADLVAQEARDKYHGEYARHS